MVGSLWAVCWLAALHAVVATDLASDPTIQLFQEYVRINTTTHNDLSEAVEFWRQLAADEGVSFNVYEYEEGYPIVVLKWAGTDSSLNSIMLNSHIDVVPAYYDDGWTYDPFSAYLDESGEIYGRGTQDMKCVSILYFAALQRLKANNVEFLRDVYMTLMPDEEVGGDYGMKLFLKSDEFAAMNVGVELDEGSPFELPMVAIFYQDKVPWQIEVDCYGEAAHGSTFPSTDSTATGMCNNVINALFKFRDEQFTISETALVTNAGVYTSVNLNIISGGTATNVIPNHVKLVFDIRLGTSVKETELQEKLESIMSESGDNITMSYIIKDQQSPASLVDTTNPYWTAIQAAANTVGTILLPTVPPGSTDARFVRLAGIPAFGLTALPNTPLLLHSVNERVNAQTFLNAIDLYENIINNLANIPAEDTNTDPSTYIVNTA